MNLKDVEEYLKENKKRVDESNAKYDPVTGEGSFTCVRKEFHMLDKYGKPIYIPADCFKNKLICDLHKCGSIKAFLEKIGLPKTKRNKQLVYQEYFKARIEYDFEFWTAKTYYIKKKDSPEDILFILNQGQRLLLKEIYDDDKAGKPVRIIMPKSRQFGGSTLIQAYIIWKMIVVLGGTNSVIVAHVENTARVIRSMYSKMLKRYPSGVSNHLG